jgi:DNA-binding response OmpR family regulator
MRLSWGAVAWFESRRDDEATVQAALQAGADDCLAWPCSRIELLARMRAVLRRCRR